MPDSSSIIDSLVPIGEIFVPNSEVSFNYLCKIYVSWVDYSIAVEISVPKIEDDFQCSDIFQRILECAIKWDYDALNEVSSDYYYNQCGQAYRIIDVMAYLGYCDFSCESDLRDAVNYNIAQYNFKWVLSSPTKKIVLSFSN